MNDIKSFKNNFKKLNLHGKTFNVSINNDFPFCMFDVDHRSGRLLPKYSVEIELLIILSTQYNFTYHLVDGKDGWGWQENGTWMGVIGQVANGTSYMAFCELSTNFERQKVIDFTHFIFPDQYAAMSQSPLPKRADFFLLNNGQVSSSVWLCLLAFFLLLATLVCGTAKLGKNTRLENENNHDISYGEVLVNFYAIYMKVSLYSIRAERKPAARLLYASWMISGLVFSTLLSSIFYSSLTVPSFEPAVDTIADLLSIATSDRRYLLCKDGTSLHADLMNLNKTKSDAGESPFSETAANNDVYHQIGLHMLRHGQQMLFETAHIVGRVEASRRNVVMAMRLTLVTHRYIQATMPLHISSDSLESITTGVALQKGSPLMEPFNFVIDTLREGGVFDFLLQNTVRKELLATQERTRTRYAHTMTGNPTQEAQAQGATVQSFKVVTLFEMMSIFLFWSFGMLVSVLVFSLEYLFIAVYRLFFYK